VGRALIIALPLLGLMARYRALRGPEGRGLGGVKLAAVAGARLGLPALFAALEPAALTAIGAYVLSAPIKRRPLKSTAFLAFGTYLAPSGSAGWRRRCGVSAPERAPIQARARACAISPRVILSRCRRQIEPTCLPR
jgi:hypothetical protein